MGKVKEYDIVIVGAGIVGAAVAYKLSQKKIHTIAVIDKEDSSGKHQTGRNSGVIHSGVYYPEGSLKSKNCLEGYRQLLAYLEAHHLPYKVTGKLIAATHTGEFSELERLFQNAKKVGLQVEYFTEKQIHDIDPHLTVAKGFFVKETGITDYKAVLKSLIEESRKNGVDFYFSNPLEKVESSNAETSIITTPTERFSAKRLIACAGLQTDRVYEQSTGLKSPVKTVAFKGEYFEVPKEEYRSDVPIYPVPDPDFPFLGVHLTRMIDGRLKVGPNAVLVLDRENYMGSSLNWKDTLEVISNKALFNLVTRYGSTVVRELLRQKSKTFFENQVQKYWPVFERNKIISYSCGIRAQATEDGELVSDFRIEKYNNQIHVLNAPSPAATSCLSIADDIIGILDGL